MANKSVNTQGLSRRDKSLMSCLLFDEGKIGFSADLSSGEPTVTSHYSGDKNYRAANFDMVGKEPYYDGDILMISDMYIAGASVSPTGQDKVKELYNTKFGTIPFAEQWVIDDEVIKGDPNVKPFRSFHKLLILAMQYGQTPKGMVANAHDKGYALRLVEAKNFYRRFWYELFPDVRKLGESLQWQYKKNGGYLINEFGFRMFPDRPEKCMNYFIQSTVTGIMSLLAMKFFNSYKDAEFMTVIHDEIVGQVDSSKSGECEKVWQEAVKSVNEDLGWTVDIRSGFVMGDNWYTCK